jgi:hypothetical protein
VREAGAVIANAPERLIKTETALSAEAGVRAGAVLFRALSERSIYTIEETRAGPAYFCHTRNSGGVIPSTDKLSGI